MSARHISSIALLITLVVGAPFGCNAESDGSGGGARAKCESAISRMRSCGVLGEGDSGCDQVNSVQGSTCILDCLLAASCDELDSYFCGSDASGSAVGACRRDCQDESDFICNNGEEISDEWVCDGEDDCSDASDEMNCGTRAFSCGDGSTIASSWRCDGAADCDDGSDEENCGSTFTCDDGTEIPSDYECDEYEDCDDGSDEQGCPDMAQLTCD